ncbi:MAG TPA: GlsB/YeaQ/YmgE family stress response membrane protein [Gaiellales bacterium]|nr:GlsB/YeaQ/YmgE family stress response membrane protein [Gemmatimonadales bacterium]HET7380691.1 GlsB/YeaQ/YmgE family stress response membrane protein [Gaiellales bacterium]
MQGTNLIYFLLIGLVAGWLAGKVMKGSGYGLIGDLVIGVVGAFLGGWIFGLLHIAAGGLLGLLVTAFVGAVVLVWLLRMIKKA